MDYYYSVFLTTLNSPVFLVLAGITVGTLWLGLVLAIIMFALPFIPSAVEMLANDPNRWTSNPHPDKRDYPVSNFGFFTKVLPGQVKVIERGGRFIRCVMRFDEHMFRGEEANSTILRNSAKYWEVIKTKKGNQYTDSHPVPLKPKWKDGWITYPLRLVFWKWVNLVYFKTGYLFTGLYPWQYVRVYPIDYFREIDNEDGQTDLQKVGSFSDHFRVADFQFPIKVGEADTKDKIPVRVLVNAIAQVENPYLAAYQVDNWAGRLAAAINDAVVSFTRPRMLDDVLSAANPEEVRMLSDSILSIGKKKSMRNSILPFGLSLRQVLIPDISPTNKSDREKLGDLAIARVDRQAKEERAIGDAAQLREQIEVVTKGGDVGLSVLATERDVRAAKSAGDKAIVILGRGDSDPLQTALLKEVRDIRNNKPKKGDDSE